MSHPALTSTIPRSARSAARGGDRRPPQSRGRIGVHARRQALCLAAELAATGELVGDCALFWLSWAYQQGEIGLGLHRIPGRCDGRNRRSARVLERSGMRLEAHLVENARVKGEWIDELICAILRREWESSRG